MGHHILLYRNTTRNIVQDIVRGRRSVTLSHRSVTLRADLSLTAVPRHVYRRAAVSEEMRTQE